MKTSKAPENTVVTPPQKKLKQARLPFKLISEVSPKTPSSPTRKRKLSVSDTEPLSKVGKISKENGITEDLVIISDDDSKDSQINHSNLPKQGEIILNPYVKLVDTVLKKKQQKKAPKKKERKTSKKVVSDMAENNNVEIQCEAMEVDEADEVDLDSENREQENKHVESTENNKDKSQNRDVNSEKSTESCKIDNIEQEGKTIENQKETTDKPEQETENLLSQSKPASSETIKVEKEKATGKTSKINILIPRSSPRTTTKNVKETKPITKTSSTFQQFQSILNENEILCIENSNSSSDKNDSKSNSDLDEKTDSEIKQADDKTIEIKDPEVSASNSESNITDTAKETCEKLFETSPKENKHEMETESSVSPQRSSRSKTKKDEDAKLDTSATSSKLNESVSSDPTTPKHKSRSSSVTNSHEDQSLNESISSVNLTPKQLQKKLEAAKKREEREKEKQEREKKRQQEKEEREKQRKEKEEQKKREREEKEEQKKREKEEKEEQKRKEREEKEKQKEMERKLKEMKEEQKRKEKEDKEEQRRKEKEAREEEKRKKQEALEIEKQEQELKKKKAAEAFVSFFVPKQKVEKDQTTGPVSKSNVLSSFTIKSDMRLAPTCRVDLSDEKRELLDKALDEQNFSENELYLKSLRKGAVKPMSSSKTWPLDEKDDDDVLIVEDELPPIDSTGQIVTCEPAPREKLRPKLLSFHQNRRPPYWGTWRKKSAFIKPRRPFGQDEKQLDYEVDSDEEWEEEQDGESVDGSACGSEDEGGDDEYEVDNEVFVPHGYLSDEEATMEDDVLSLTPETQKARLKHLEDEFESELKKPTEKLKPRLYGLLWENSDGGKPENCVDALWNYFSKFSMIFNDPAPLFQPSKEPEEPEKKKIKKKKIPTEGEEPSPKREKKKKSKVEQKESKKIEAKKTVPNQPGINSFLTIKKTT